MIDDLQMIQGEHLGFMTCIDSTSSPRTGRLADSNGTDSGADSVGLGRLAFRLGEQCFVALVRGKRRRGSKGRPSASTRFT